jgi:hypothetical protein
VAKFTKLYRQTEKPTPQTIHLRAKPITTHPKNSIPNNAEAPYKWFDLSENIVFF